MSATSRTQMKHHERATEAALQAFWDVIAVQFPDIPTGDLPPDLDFEFTICARKAVSEWIRINKEG